MSDAQLPMVDPFRSWTPRPAANSRRKIIRQALLRALDEDMGDGTKAIDHFAKAQVAAAIDGSVDAAKFVTDRVDGRQLGTAELAGEAEQPQVIDDTRIMRALVLLMEEQRLRDRAIDLKPE